MTDHLQKTPRERSIQEGRQIVIALMAYFIMVEIFTLVITLFNGQYITVVSIIRFLLTLVTVVYLYKGKNWAKLLLSLGAVLGFFGLAYAIFLQLKSPTISIFNFLFVSIVTVLQGLAAYLLIFSSAVEEFVKSRKV